MSIPTTSVDALSYNGLTFTGFFPGKDTTKTPENHHTRYTTTRRRMAEHIVSTTREIGTKNYVLVVGAGHVVSLKDALNKLYPSLKVRLIDK